VKKTDEAVPSLQRSGKINSPISSAPGEWDGHLDYQARTMPIVPLLEAMVKLRLSPRGIQVGSDGGRRY
jgi:hypothetical protein